MRLFTLKCHMDLSFSRANFCFYLTRRNLKKTNAVPSCFLHTSTVTDEGVLAVQTVRDKPYCRTFLFFGVCEEMD